MPAFSRVARHPAKQARLAVPPAALKHERRVAVGEIQQVLRLGFAIDEIRWGSTGRLKMNGLSSATVLYYSTKQSCYTELLASPRPVTSSTMYFNHARPKEAMR